MQTTHNPNTDIQTSELGSYARGRYDGQEPPNRPDTRLGFASEGSDQPLEHLAGILVEAYIAQKRHEHTLKRK
jgi:hypothetical protein